MTPTQFRIIDLISFVFSPAVAEECLSHKLEDHLTSATVNEKVLCTLDEDEQFFIKMIPLQSNKSLLHSQAELVNIIADLAWTWILQRHSLQASVIGLRLGWKVVSMDKSSSSNPYLDGLFASLFPAKPNPKEVN